MGGSGHGIRFRMVLPAHQELGRCGRAGYATGFAGRQGVGPAYHCLHDLPACAFRAAIAQLQLGDTDSPVRKVRSRVVHQTRNPHRVRTLPAQGMDHQSPHRPGTESHIPWTQHTIPGTYNGPSLQRGGPAALPRLLRGGRGRLRPAEQPGRDQPGTVRPGTCGAI